MDVCEDGHERRGEGAFAEEPAEEVGDLEGQAEGVGVARGAEGGDAHVTEEAEEAGDEGDAGDELGGAEEVLTFLVLAVDVGVHRGGLYAEEAIN